jgi:hypothetical protein
VRAAGTPALATRRGRCARLTSGTPAPPAGIELTGIRGHTRPGDAGLGHVDDKTAAAIVDENGTARLAALAVIALDAVAALCFTDPIPI